MAAKRQHIALIRHLKARPRLFLAGLISILIAWFMNDVWHSRGISALLIGWNAGMWSYLVMAIVFMVGEDPDDIHRRAASQDEGAIVILMLVVVSALASLAAIVAELSMAKELAGGDRLAHSGLAAVTILGSWAFTQVMFAFHYAHDYYSSVSKGQSGGLIFPETKDPDYFDFLYFSAIIGTSAQTADVSFSNRTMRRVGLVHCVLAFLFNTSLIALTINVASSLL